MLDVVHWCSFCSARPADGNLTIVDNFGEESEVPACYACVDDIQRDQEEQIDGYGDTHD